MDVRVFVEEKLKPKLLENPHCLKNASIRSKRVVIELDGSDGGVWVFEFDKNGDVHVSDASDSRSDCSIWMKTSTFEKMVGGTLNVPVAFVMRKIKVQGDVGIAANVGLALQKLF